MEEKEFLKISGQQRGVKQSFVIMGFAFLRKEQWIICSNAKKYGLKFEVRVIITVRIFSSFWQE